MITFHKVDSNTSANASEANTCRISYMPATAIADIINHNYEDCLHCVYHLTLDSSSNMRGWVLCVNHTWNRIHHSGHNHRIKGPLRPKELWSNAHSYPNWRRSQGCVGISPRSGRKWQTLDETPIDLYHWYWTTEQILLLVRLVVVLSW